MIYNTHQEVTEIFVWIIGCCILPLTHLEDGWRVLYDKQATPSEP